MFMALRHYLQAPSNIGGRPTSEIRIDGCRQFEVAGGSGLRVGFWLQIGLFRLAFGKFSLIIKQQISQFNKHEPTVT